MSGLLRRVMCLGGAAALVICAAVAGNAQAADAHPLSQHAAAYSPSPGADNYLEGVQALSPSNAWAAGWYCNSCTSSSAVIRDMILHWNGSAWKQVSIPSPGVSDQLFGVTASSTSNAWAVGSYFSEGGAALVLHWNGITWSQVKVGTLPQGNPSLYGVSAVSANDAWAVGSIASTTSRTLTLHWNGTTWSAVSSPSPGKAVDVLSGVSVQSATNAWAVGNYCSAKCETAAQQLKTVTMHWNGTSWSRK